MYKIIAWALEDKAVIKHHVGVGDRALDTADNEGVVLALVVANFIC